MAKKKVGILGSGQVAQALGSGFLKHGYDVMVGSRDTGKLVNWQSKNTQAKLGSFEAAAKFGDLIVLAVKGAAAESLIKSLATSLAGKTILDTTNPIADAPPENGVLKYFTTLENSLMERLQKIAPAANLVKAFSSVGNAVMVNPVLPGGNATMFICGNDIEAKKEAASIPRSLRLGCGGNGKSRSCSCH